MLPGSSRNHRGADCKGYAKQSIRNTQVHGLCKPLLKGQKSGTSCQQFVANSSIFGLPNTQTARVSLFFFLAGELQFLRNTFQETSCTHLFPILHSPMDLTNLTVLPSNINFEERLTALRSLHQPELKRAATEFIVAALRTPDGPGFAKLVFQALAAVDEPSSPRSCASVTCTSGDLHVSYMPSSRTA